MTAPPDNSRTLAGYNLSLSDPTRVCRVNSDTGRSRDRALGAPPHRPPKDVSRLPMEKSSAARDQLIPAALPNTALRKLATGACLSLADRGIASRTRARFASQEELGGTPLLYLDEEVERERHGGILSTRVGQVHPARAPKEHGGTRSGQKRTAYPWLKSAAARLREATVPTLEVSRLLSPPRNLLGQRIRAGSVAAVCAARWTP